MVPPPRTEYKIWGKAGTWASFSALGKWENLESTLFWKEKIACLLGFPRCSTLPWNVQGYFVYYSCINGWLILTSILTCNFIHLGADFNSYFLELLAQQQQRELPIRQTPFTLEIGAESWTRHHITKSPTSITIWFPRAPNSIKSISPAALSISGWCQV